MGKKIIIAILALFMAGVAFAQLVPTSKKWKERSWTGRALRFPAFRSKRRAPPLVGKATAVTDGDGTYRLFSLPSGVYEITFTLQGFKTLIGRTSSFSCPSRSP